MNDNKEWIPIIPKEHQTKYWNKIIGITNAVNTSKLNEVYPTLRDENNFPSLMSGYTCQALYFSTLQHSQSDFNYLPTIKNLISNVLENINKPNTSYTYADGIAGFGWFLNYIQEDLPEDVNHYLLKLDNSLFELSVNLTKNRNYDFLHGSLGLLYYYIERNNYDYVNHITELIINLRIEKNNETYWEYFDVDAHKISQNCVSFGLAHGMPSILFILAKIYEKKLFHTPEKLKSIIESGINFLLSHRNNSMGSVFPCQFIINKNKGDYSPLGWCYGDLSLAYTLFQIGEIMKDSNLMNTSIDIALTTLNRIDLPVNGIYDSCLCHGTSGLAHIYNRFYQSTKRNEFKEQALFWYTKTLDIATYIDGITGYKTRFMINNKSVYHNDLSLLNGVIGVSLAFLAGVSPFEPKWDRILLLN